MDKCRADVTICGADYVLSGEKSEDKIKEIAKFVDDELRRTSRALNSNPNYKCAVLTAINIAEKLMENSDLLLKLQTENHQLDNDVQHYITLWENAKKERRKNIPETARHFFFHDTRFYVGEKLFQRFGNNVGWRVENAIWN